MPTQLGSDKVDPGSSSSEETRKLRRYGEEKQEAKLVTLTGTAGSGCHWGPGD